MHYLIDGYNVVFKIAQPSKQFLVNKKHLLSLLEEIANCHTQFTIIFDSKQKYEECHSLKSDFVKVITICSKLTAEEYIFEMLQKKENYKHTTVVSSDNYLVRKCRTIGCDLLTSDEFLFWLYKRASNKHLRKNEEPQEFQESYRQAKRLETIFQKRLKWLDQNISNE